ncbi:MarR family protein [Ruegeria denitrificans]|uniref:MarR family protein n=1 Tax=Ruegeria denitrificans TaxID=1715692 RepID=A0A0P1IJ15_9RHOB|nr:MarR family transcriptional regulator [Ruegeria denitrificans]CUK15426.1 MarR family protein [Ruegeria denitrificans]
MNFHLIGIMGNSNQISDEHKVVNNDLPTPQETDIWVAMNRTTRLIQSEISTALKDADLPPLKWYDLLWSLERHGGRLRPYELTQDVIFEQSNLSHLTKRLATEGLIEIVGLDSDRRGKILQITEKGKDLRKRMWEIYGPLLHEKMLAFSNADGWKAFIETARHQAESPRGAATKNRVNAVWRSQGR